MKNETRPTEVFVHVCGRCKHVYDRVTGKPKIESELSIPPDLRILGECKDCNDKMEDFFLQSINDSIKKKETQ